LIHFYKRLTFIKEIAVMSNSMSFIRACHAGDENKAKEVYESDQSVLNTTATHVARGYSFNITGLMAALTEGHHSICRWLLSLPGIDTNNKSVINSVEVHMAFYFAVSYNAPLDLIISLERLASKEKTDGLSANDLRLAADNAVERNQTPTIIYLSWLGAEFKEEHRRFGHVTLQTWLDAGCQQDAPMWAVAAKDLNALKQLTNMEEITIDKPVLLDLAALFGHHEIKCYLEENQNLKIYSNQMFSDFEITFKERTFPCHKSFLSSLSGPIQALIEEKTRKNLPMKTELENCPDATVAESFVKFFYIGGIDKDLLDGHLVTFLHLSDFYRIKGLHIIVEDTMISQLSKDNVKEFFIAADKYQGERVKAAAIEFMRMNRGVWREDIEEWKPFISRELLCELVISLI